jgi:hypothetical protein
MSPLPSSSPTAKGFTNGIWAAVGLASPPPALPPSTDIGLTAGRLAVGEGLGLELGLAATGLGLAAGGWSSAATVTSSPTGLSSARPRPRSLRRLPGGGVPSGEAMPSSLHFMKYPDSLGCTRVLKSKVGGTLYDWNERKLGRQALSPLLVQVVVALQQNMKVFWMLKRRRKRSIRTLSGMVPLM